MKRALYWIPVFAWMLLIFLMSNRERMSITETASTDFFIFKTGHMVEYAVLALLLLRALIFELGSTKIVFILAATISVLFAISDEFHQTFIMSRDGKLFDVMIDSIGIFSVLLVCYMQSLRKTRTK